MTKTAEATLKLSDKEVIARAPMLIFLLVATADGELDDKAHEHFNTILQKPEFATLVTAMQQSRISSAAVMEELQSGAYDLLEELHSLALVLEHRVPAEPSLRIKITLVALGKAFAEATGGSLGTGGHTISKEEKLALATIVIAFGLTDTTAVSGVSRNNERPDLANVFPLLKPATWAKEARNRVYLHDVYGGDDVQPDEPVVAYVVDRPESVEFIDCDAFDGGDLTVQSLREHAMANLERRLQREGQWKDIEFDPEIEGVGPVKGVAFQGDYYCAEALLSKVTLKEAHKRTNSALLMVATPERGGLYATPLVNPEQPEPEKMLFMALALKRFFNPNEAPITATVWITRNGKVVGHVTDIEEVIDSARAHAEAEISDEREKLLCEVETANDKDGERLVVAVTALDIDIMLKNLQHIVRKLAQQSSDLEGFSGRIDVAIQIADPNFEPTDQVALTESLDGLFAYLNDQVNALFAPKLGKAFTLRYDVTVS